SGRSRLPSGSLHAHLPGKPQPLRIAPTAYRLGRKLASGRRGCPCRSGGCGAGVFERRLPCRGGPFAVSRASSSGSHSLSRCGPAQRTGIDSGPTVACLPLLASVGVPLSTVRLSGRPGSWLISNISFSSSHLLSLQVSQPILISSLFPIGNNDRRNNIIRS